MSAIDPRDRAIFNSLPLIMAPRHDQLPVLEIGAKRLVAGSDGLYLEVRSPAVHFCQPIGEADLPYGDVEPFVRLTAGPVPRLLIAAAIGRAVAAAPNETALAVLLNADGTGYVIEDVPIDSSSTDHVRYTDTLDDDRLVLDIHSHGALQPYFSATDNESDRSRRGPYIALVIGTCETEETATVAARLCASPYLFNVPTHALSDWGVIA